MIELLSYRDQRILRMSEMLILSSNAITIQEFMHANKSSLKTVYDDLSYLKGQFDNILKIEIDNGNVSSSSTSIGDLMLIRKNIFYRNLGIRIYASLYFERKLSMDDFIKRFHYSKSKIRKEINRCNQLLSYINVAIEVNEGLFYLKSEDESILAYLAALIVLGSGYPDKIYNEKDQLIASSKFESKRKLTIPGVIRDEILLADALFEKYSRKFSCPIYCASLPDGLVEDVKERLVRYGMNKNQEIELLEDILRSLYYKMNVFKMKSILSEQRYHYFYLQFLKENTALVQEYEKNIKELQNRWKLPFNYYKEELLFLIYIHFPQIRNYKRFYIGVYSDLGNEHANILLKRLEKNFKLHNFEIYNNKKKYDLILSTANHEVYLEAKDTKIVTVSDFLTPDNYKELYSALYISQT